MRGLKQLNFNLKYFRFNFFTLLITFLVLIELILSQIPLTKIFGFEYSTINAIVLYLFCGLITLKFAQINEYSNFIKINKALFQKAILFLIISFALGLLSNYVFTNCPINDGILFFVVTTIPSAILGIFTASFILYFLKRYTYIIFTLVFFCLLLIPIIEFYFNPQIYFYNTVFGYFLGTIYDEDISVDWTLIGFRIYNLSIYALLVSTLYIGIKFRIKKYLSFSIFVLILIISVLLKPYLGFSTTNTRLKSELPITLETKNFRIHFSDLIKEKNERYLIGLLHEYYYGEVSDLLHEKRKDKIDSYIYDNDIQKKKLFGSEKADVAKPWLNQIHISKSSLHETLKHEIVHILSANFGVTPFKVAHNLNPALIEGIAVAIENRYNIYSVDYLTKLARLSGFNINAEKLFEGLSFFAHSSSLSYNISGSFFRFLINEYGIDKVKNFYSNGNTATSFGKGMKELQLEFDKYLDRINLIPNNNLAKLYFSGVPVFKKYCPRSAANDIKKGWKFFNKKEYENSLLIFQDVYNYSNTYSSLSGYVNSLFKLNRIDDAEIILKKEISKFIDTPYFYHLELLLGDLYYLNSKKVNALALYDSLLTQNVHIEYNNQVMIRKSLIDNGNLLSQYLTAERKHKIEILKRLNEKETNYYTLPTLLSLCSKEEIEIILNNFNYLKDAEDINESFAMYEISKKYVNIGKYELSKKYLISALKYKEDNFLEYALTEQLKLTNWIINFAKEVSSEFTYK